MIEHPYIKYAVALIMAKRNYQSYDLITIKDIVDELNICRAEFSIKLKESLTKKESIAFVYSDEKPNWAKNTIDSGGYVIASPHIASSDINSLYTEISSIIANLDEKKASLKGDIKKSLFPIGGEYLRFSNSGSVGKAYTKLTNKDIALMAITALTSKKPCCSIWTKKGKVNTCIIPDFSLNATKDFISFFNRLEKQKSDGLFIGRTFQKGKKVCTNLPRIYGGNYSNASRSSYLQTISVLGYIGELIKEKDYSSKAENVTKELEENPILLIKPIPKLESAEVIKYNHYIIEIAKNGSLNKIIDSLYYIKFYKFKGLNRTDSDSKYKNKGIQKDEKDIEYDKFDYYTSKFLILFNHYTFNEFLSCRVEYPSEIKKILTIYFLNMEQINKEIIKSVEAFGAWINRSAFSAALADAYPGKSWGELIKKFENDSKTWEEVKRNVAEKKYKFLTNLESSIFSAADNTSMVANIMTQVGRLSNSDAPEEVKPFMEAVFTSSITFPSAKNLLIAFSRVYSKNERVIEDNNQNEKEIVDSSNI